MIHDHYTIYCEGCGTRTGGCRCMSHAKDGRREGLCAECQAKQTNPVPVPPPTPLDLEKLVDSLVAKTWECAITTAAGSRIEATLKAQKAEASAKAALLSALAAPRLPAKAETPKEVDQAWAEIRDTMADKLLNVEQKKTFVISILKGQLAHPPEPAKAETLEARPEPTPEHEKLVDAYTHMLVSYTLATAPRGTEPPTNPYHKRVIAARAAILAEFSRLQALAPSQGAGTPSKNVEDYGYQPGNYTGTCKDCGFRWLGQSKRSFRCIDCAMKARDAAIVAWKAPTLEPQGSPGRPDVDEEGEIRGRPIPEAARIKLEEAQAYFYHDRKLGTVVKVKDQIKVWDLIVMAKSFLPEPAPGPGEGGT